MSLGQQDSAALRRYEPPRISVMNEDEVLKMFQLTSAMTSWWLPGGSPIG